MYYFTDLNQWHVWCSSLTFFDLFFLFLATVFPCLVGVASVVALAVESICEWKMKHINRTNYWSVTSNYTLLTIKKKVSSCLVSSNINVVHVPGCEGSSLLLLGAGGSLLIGWGLLREHRRIHTSIQHTVSWRIQERHEDKLLYSSSIAIEMLLQKLSFESI